MWNPFFGVKKKLNLQYILIIFYHDHDVFNSYNLVNQQNQKRITITWQINLPKNTIEIFLPTDAQSYNNNNDNNNNNMMMDDDIYIQ